MFRKPKPTFRDKIADGVASRKHSLGYLNISQFLGVVNDNLFKFVLGYMLIDVYGANHTNLILFLAGAIFVIPFLIFSSSAGVLADRYSKQRILRYIKGVEIVIMLLAFIAFGMKSAWAGYTLLFLLAAQSAVFGPAKYGIIPELVEKEAISKTNGLITSFTYLGIILGTFLASFLTDKTNHQYLLVIAFALALSIIGFITSFGVKYTTAQGSKKKFNPYFIRSIFKTLHSVKNERHLLLSAVSSAYFLFIGAFTQLNMIPFAMQSFGLNEVYGGYLFFTAAIGIAAGSFLAGKASKKRVELAISCISGFFIAIFLMLLGLISHHLTVTIIILLILGFSGGTFVIPFDTFVQVFSPQENRGQVIAASNFLGFVGVLIAAFAILILGTVMDLTAATGFFLVGLITLFYALFLLARLSDFFVHFFSRKLVLKRYLAEKPDLTLLETHKDLPLILEQRGLKEVLILLGLVPHLHLFVTQKKHRRFPWFEHLFYSLHLIKPEKTLSAIIEKKRNLIKPDEHLCIYGQKREPHEDIGLYETVKSFFGIGHTEAIVVSFHKKPGDKKATVTFIKKPL